MECESTVFSPHGEGSSKPPDDDTHAQRTSFRDKLMGGIPAPPSQKFEDLIENGTMKVIYVDDNPLLPRIVVERRVIDDMCSIWTNALVVALLGKRLGYKLMKAKLTSLWKLSGDFDLIDVDNGFYMVKFDRDEDRDKVMSGGPWMIFDHYLAVATWSPEFISPAARVKKTLAWIRIPGLNVAFYNESYLMSAARAIGKPIRLDRNTLRADRGRFARICVELDLDKPVVGKICLEDYWYKIEYEGLHVICTKCGCYGHRACECKVQDKPTPNGSVSPVSEKVAGAPGEKTGNDGQVGPMEDQTMEGTLPKEAVTEGISASRPIIDDAIQVEKNGINPNNGAEGDPHGQWLTVTKRKKQNKKKPIEHVAKVAAEVLPVKKKGNGSQGKLRVNDEKVKAHDVMKKHNGIQGKNIPASQSNDECIIIGEALKGKSVASPTPQIFQFGSSSGPTLDTHNKKRRLRGDDWDRVISKGTSNEMQRDPLQIRNQHTGGLSEDVMEMSVTMVNDLKLINVASETGESQEKNSNVINDERNH
ncbi:uncharacterized protein LOC130733681 [Lotus japonicus]|uniref:uncharacterized protein LOC130733681 n=1 Tax=Lotus japonicus TaxID=34305 RepID=UPI002583BFE3|nr:uncharacterized protein LOC130733681 [Lotus japonicus]XP_057441891.1 uncharacterized protein LOC130733681 [Lotus japonicus]XP_057441892.1 uncharacterized protein LOC130733681 [Lotus japonicus]XP_057441893.1 uncharacterized protein LOC130733681 [Lotus japonicus]XP_057441894.1 uncharacterized protein LOC130733681 [Lotus japonicus]XP_057441895.1 uncharacterized protein LOC130733681 [Lotus japonicus]XP_057441896.1 uncharacterized protein LOC130733681 [Lotus japonicus]XP_057441897.1 uncharacte